MRRLAARLGTYITATEPRLNAIEARLDAVDKRLSTIEAAIFRIAALRAAATVVMLLFYLALVLIAAPA